MQKFVANRYFMCYNACNKINKWRVKLYDTTIN